MHCLMFIRIRKDQQYAQICTIPLFYVSASKCFGSSLPSSGSFLDPPELLEIQIDLLVYHIMCCYVTSVSDCCVSACCVSQLSQMVDTTDGTTAIRHTGHVTTHCMIYHLFDFYFKQLRRI
jgi:hypothetical protein